ncbi:hypothetical protein EON67_09680 [archaeon]|nr:MAG: hypothetical protein EON67_09680 [archaeon]
MSLLDLSVDTWVAADLPARATFLSSFYMYKHSAPYIGPVMLFLLCLLPFAIIPIVKDDIPGLFKSPASRPRHIVNVINLVGIVCAVSLGMVLMRPAEVALIAKPSEEALNYARRIHLANWAINFGMMFLPFFKLSTGHLGVEDDAASTADASKTTKSKAA